jgi:predicted MPP superfamily phosphohydrolase
MSISILHFSDLHYDKKYDTKIKDIRDKFIENLVRDNDNIDLVIFSGDLVQKPSDVAFEEAYENFIKPMIEELKIGIDNVSITCGNHDVYNAPKNQDH